MQREIAYLACVLKKGLWAVSYSLLTLKPPAVPVEEEVARVGQYNAMGPECGFLVTVENILVFNWQ